MASLKLKRIEDSPKKICKIKFLLKKFNILFFRCGKISGMKLGSRYRVAAVSFVVLVVASVGIEASPQGPML